MAGWLWIPECARRLADDDCRVPTGSQCVLHLTQPHSHPFMPAHQPIPVRQARARASRRRKSLSDHSESDNLVRIIPQKHMTIKEETEVSHHTSDIILLKTFSQLFF